MAKSDDQWDRLEAQRLCIVWLEALDVEAERARVEAMAEGPEKEAAKRERRGQNPKS